MHPINKLAAHLYYLGTAGIRRRRWRRACTARQAPIGILVFHRVANDFANKWTTPISTFSKAICWLKKNVELISLEEVQRRVASGENDRVRMSITFDDGYADNCQFAMPLLIEQKIPCTYFVSVDPVLKNTPFAHDIANGQRISPNTICQLRSLGDHGVEIGAHTRTHADLGRVTRLTHLMDEVVYARDDLQQALGRRVRFFAFPFGRHANLTVTSFRLLHNAGYEAACSAYGGYNHPGCDPFHLKRRCLDGALLRIKNWVTVDPFRNRNVVEFDHGALNVGERKQFVESPGAELLNEWGVPSNDDAIANAGQASLTLGASSKNGLPRTFEGARKSVNREN